MMTKSIVFLMTTSGIGGEVITNLRLAEWLHVNTDYKIYCADIPGGASLAYIKKQGYSYITPITLNVVTDKNGKPKELKDTVFPDNSLIFTNGFFLWKNSILKHIIADNIRFLFYFVEPHTCTDVLQQKFFLKRIIKKIKLKKIFKQANSRNALVFQDYPNFRNIASYYHQLNKRYLPIPIYHKPARQNWKCADNNIRLCYIGRNCSSKNRALYFFTEQLSKYIQQNNQSAVTLHIVSDINKEDRIYIKLRQKFPNVKIVLEGTLYESKLENFLTEKIDIVLGMGVSCLEAVRLGLPSISAPAAVKKIPLKTKVGTIADFNDYALGGYLNEDNGLHNGKLFPDLLNDICQNYDNYAAQNYSFSKEHFNIEAVMPKFLKYVDETSFEYKDIGK